MAEPNIKKIAEPQKKVPRLRSPAYPGINLEMAIKRAQQFYDHEKRNAAPVSVALKHWNFKEKSGGGMIAVAALKAFGLMADTGSGNKRNVQLTDAALRIILDQRQDSAEREAAIKAAAIRPKMHATLWKKWATSLPSDDNLRHALVFDWKFNENTVGDFIKEYKDTIRFAKLSDSDTVSAGEDDIQGDNEMPAGDAIIQPARQGDHRLFAPPTIPGSKEISMPVGVSEEGQAIFAHVRFDAPLRKDYLKSLRGLLEALEKGLV